jgi:serine/threonine-protein kinase HipA
MQRREALQASQERRELRALHESDYLLGVQDFSRMGALRFAAAIGGPFLADDELYMCPPIAGLRDLEWMTMKFEEEYDESSHEYREWLNQIIAPGSSLGGARPKSGVLDVDDSLWIAKFPSNRDTYDVGGWEMVVHELASRVGIQVPSAKIQRFSSRYHTFLSKRFDRTDTQRRVHFASAMALLGYTDGAGAQEGVSYLELASLIHRSGSRPDRDLKELWKRIVFSIYVSNSDDHLRNHGFLLDEDGWRLSPAYDINPVPHAQSLSLNVNEYDNSMRLSLAVEVAPYFRLTEAEAKREIEAMKEIISSWKMIASSYGIPASEQRMMSPAFDRI